MLIQPAIDASSPVEEVQDDVIVVEHHRRLSRRARILIVAVVVALAGGGVWWHQAVTADPGLSFDGGPNVFRNAEGGDLTGIERVENSFGTDVNVAYQAGAPLHGFFPGRAGLRPVPPVPAPSRRSCDPAGLQSGFSRIRSLPVRYRTLGITRTAIVPLDEVTIAIHTIGKCDHPLPNRS